MSWAVCVHPHHSIAGVYDGRRQVTIEAVVREFRFTHPHPLIVVEIEAVSDESVVPPEDRRRPWTLEMDNRWELAELGFTDETLQPGDEITVTGSLARRQRRALYVRRLEHAAADFTYEHHR